MSLKDKGNQEVKKGNLPAAIECYLKYVEEEHQDNYTAFTNLALCYFKLKQHEKCIEACRNSIEHNPDNAKAYYRLYMTYKELPGQEYNTYINAQLFLKHFHDDNPTSQSEAIKIAKEYKEKFSKSVASKKMEEDLIEGLDVLGKDYRGKFQEGKEEMTNEEWIAYFEDRNVTIDQKAGRTKQLILNQHQLGVNLGYLLLNMTDSNQNKAFVQEKMAQAKKEYAEKKVSQSSTPKEQMEEEQRQCANDSDDDSQGKIPFVQKQDSLEQSDTQVQNKVEATSQAQENKPAQKKQIVEAKSSPSIVQARPELTIQAQFSNFMKTHQQSRDVMNLIFEIICKILASQQSLQTKRGYLAQVQKKCKETALLKFSLTERQNKKLFELLKSNGLQKEFKFCKAI